jgi:hypothetical protein
MIAGARPIASCSSSKWKGSTAGLLAMTVAELKDELEVRGSAVRASDQVGQQGV